MFPWPLIFSSITICPAPMGGHGVALALNLLLRHHLLRSNGRSRCCPNLISSSIAICPAQWEFTVLLCRRYRGPGPWPALTRRNCWLGRLRRAPWACARGWRWLSPQAGIVTLPSWRSSAAAQVGYYTPAAPSSWRCQGSVRVETPARLHQGLATWRSCGGQRVKATRRLRARCTLSTGTWSPSRLLGSCGQHILREWARDAST